MKIMICGSMTFAKEMRQIENKLKELRHDVSVPIDINIHLSDSKFCNNLEKDFKHCIENDTIRKCFKLIAKSDAILVLNLNKNGVKGYVGTSGLMEVGLAHYLNKKIFLFNKLPSYNKVRWAHEVAIMQPKIIDGDLTKIK